MKFQLPSGRWIALAELRQYQTFAGLLAGKPDQEMNDRRIQDALDGARRDYPAFGEPLLIEPKNRANSRSPGQVMAQERIPAVTCIGVFESGELHEGHPDVYSSLIILWFQDQFALPVAPTVLSTIRAINWETRAVGWTP